MRTKFIITGTHKVNKNRIASDLCNKSEAMTQCKLFSSNPRYEENEDYIYLEGMELNIAYKNNALLYVAPDGDDQFFGVTMEEFYNNNVVVMELEQFNSLSQHVFEMNDIVVIWVDSSFRIVGSQMKKDAIETKYLMERLQYIKYMYFLNEHTEVIADTIIEYNNSDDLKRLEILKNNR